MQTANKLLKKAYGDKKYPCLEILELRNTIPGVGLSPTLLLMGRRTRSIIRIKMYFSLVFEVISRACFPLTPAASFIVSSMLLLVSF